MTKVALSGASGNMGRMLRAELPGRGVDLRSAGGRTPLEPLHDGEDDAQFRPDGLYGLSKVWGEAMARMYWDKHGIEGFRSASAAARRSRRTSAT